MVEPTVTLTFTDQEIVMLVEGLKTLGQPETVLRSGAYAHGEPTGKAITTLYRRILFAK